MFQVKVNFTIQIYNERNGFSEPFNTKTTLTYCHQVPAENNITA